jgi:hypothetical protein
MPLILPSAIGEEDSDAHCSSEPLLQTPSLVAIVTATDATSATTTIAQGKTSGIGVVAGSISM